MRRLAIAASVAALTLIGGHASATTYLRYDFIAQSSFDGQFHGSFTAFFPIDAIPPLGPATTTSLSGADLPLCVTTRGGDTNDCWAAKLRPDGGLFPADPDAYSEFGGYDDIELWYKPADTTDAQCAADADGHDCHTYAYVFQSGALSTPGFYLSSLRDSDPTTGQTGEFADERAVLRVSVVTSTDAIATVVPEPGVWGLMIVGFGAIGSALRLQRRRFIRA